MSPVESSAMLTVEALRFYVPIFQKADIYYETYAAEPTESNRTLVNAALKLREMTVDYLMELAKPLMVKEIHRLLSTSHVRKNDESLFDLLYYAGRGGAIRGLRHFDVELIDKSATNYLFMWITTYAKKELNAIEAAPFGIPPARFNVYKKISAVRKKLSAELERYATNEEVLQHFLSGGADLITQNGRKADAGKPSKVNQNITLEMIEEQEYFERNLISQNLIDPLDQQTNKTIFGTVTEVPFMESIFGVFLQSYPFTAEAKVALMSELQASMDDNELELLNQIDSLTLKRLSFRWKLLMKDKNGIFAEFLRAVRNDGYQEFDIAKTLQMLDEQPELIKPSQWEMLLVSTKEKRQKKTGGKQ